MDDYRYNYSDSSELVRALRELIPHREWLATQRPTWNTIEAVDYAEVLTKRGFAHTFNIIEDEKLLNLNK
jgi:hypothetical protein